MHACGMMAEHGDDDFDLQAEPWKEEGNAFERQPEGSPGRESNQSEPQPKARGKSKAKGKARGSRKSSSKRLDGPPMPSNVNMRKCKGHCKKSKNEALEFNKDQTVC